MIKIEELFINTSAESYTLTIILLQEHFYSRTQKSISKN